MIVLVILACIGPFFIKGPNGKPLMTIEDLLPAGASEPAPIESKTVYRWQDENGVWQFSDDPAAAGLAEQMVLDGNINTMPAIEVPPPQQAAANKLEPAGVAVGGVSVRQTAQMVETVTNLQETLDQRKVELDETLAQP